MININTTCILDQVSVLARQAFHIHYTTPYRKIVKWTLDGVLNDKVVYVVNTLLYLSYVFNLISERSVLKVQYLLAQLRVWGLEELTRAAASVRREGSSGPCLLFTSFEPQYSTSTPESCGLKVQESDCLRIYCSLTNSLLMLPLPCRMNTTFIFKFCLPT